MDNYEKLPDKKITSSGEISNKFLNLHIKSFKDACYYIHDLEYGYNSTYEDDLILFKENKGTCTTKHAIIAGLAEELGISLHKHMGIYKFTEKISRGADEIMEKYNIPYVPMVHCFLTYKTFRFDLTEGNNNGKLTSIDNFIHEQKVEPFISRNDEYLLFRKVVEDKILNGDEMKHVKMKTILKARLEAIDLLKRNIN